MESYINHEQGKYHPLRPSRPMPLDNWPYQHRPNSGEDPQFGIKSPKFERHIFIRRDMVIFSIDSQLGMIADARLNADGTENDRLSSATTKYRQMFYEWIEKYIGKAKTIMAAAVLEKFNDTAMNSVKDKDETDITLLVPEWYDDTTFQQLCDAVHAYVVNATMAEYLSLALTSKDPVAADKMLMRQDDESEIRKLVNFSKPGRIHKPLKPF